MDGALLIHRLHFAFTVTYHYLFPQLTMGLAPLIVALKTLSLSTKNEAYDRAARFWARIFGINFVLGVVTGVPMEFQFGTNWALFSRYAGGVIGQTLAMEGTFAFFLESAFLGLFLYGEKRLSRFAHWLSAVAVFLGSWLSGYFIVATDAWMQHPVAYSVSADGSVSLQSFWGLILNPWALWQYFHNMAGAALTGAFVMMAVGSFFLLAKKHEELVQILHSPLASRGGLSAALHFGLGLAYMELKSFREAAEQFRRCIEKREQPSLTPTNRDIHRAGPHHCLAICLTQLREFEAAMDAYREALAADPQSRKVRFDFAAFLALSGLPVDALKQLHALVSERADELPVWLLGGQVALSQPQFAEFACDWTKEAVGFLPQDPHIREQRAEALLLNGNACDALTLWRESVSPRGVAARLICELVAGQRTATFKIDEVAVSREFLHWYRRLVDWGANSVILTLNENVHTLRKTLPTAASALGAAFSEVHQLASV